MISAPFEYLKEIPELNRPLECLTGIGSKRAALFSQKGLFTLLDLLFFTPIRYEDRSRITSIAETSAGMTALVRGKVIAGKEARFRKSGKRLFRMLIEDETAVLELLWFHYKKAQFSRFTRQGMGVMAYGRIHGNQDKRQMIHPDMSVLGRNDEGIPLGFMPVYSKVKGISGHMLRSLIKEALDQCQGRLVDAIPPRITRHLSLPDLSEAIAGIHFPGKETSVDELNRFTTRPQMRLSFDRLFWVMLSMAFRRKARKNRPAPAFTIPKDMVERFERFLPFKLTEDQLKTIRAILNDLSSGTTMNRLLQGDVGCGKTVVAAAAAFAAVLNTWQVAIMAPTQVLAQQHFGYFSNLSQAMGFRPVLLTGARKKSDRLKDHEKVAQGAHNLIIGTQALIQEDLSFARLGLVIIDEQHRFGVRQRALLDQKGLMPHQLVMTATPIPRTLAMTIYADMDISEIRQYPRGYRPVKTCLVNRGNKRHVFDAVMHRMSMGQQAMVICPVIEGSDTLDLKNVLDMYESLKQLFSPRFRVGLIHGRLCSSEKDRIMAQFRGGLIDLLVGTTVVEVGIHAPGATLMVVMHPERFGLAQLHQLRGRVGRGSIRGLCLLVLSKRISANAVSRLNLLVESHDGFYIAQKDLEMRGQGEFMGVRQAGGGELDFEEIIRAPDLLKYAKRAAESVLQSDPHLCLPENRLLRHMVALSWRNHLDL